MLNLSKAWYRFKYVYAPQLRHKIPIDVSLELSSHCNQVCGYCYHADQKHLPFEKGFMDIKTAQLIIVEAANLNVPSIKINWKGESTLNPHFEEITRFIKDHSSKKAFMERLLNSNFKFPNTNESIFRGLCNMTKVKISFDSFDRAVLERQRKGANYDLAVSNITKFYNHKGRRDTEIVIQAVRTSLNKEEDFAHEISKRWPNVSLSVRDMVGGRVAGEKGFKKRDDLKRQSCIQAHARIIFNHKGKAFPCCPDIAEKLAIGDIYENGLYQIFNSVEAKTLRKELLNGKAFEKDPCKTCPSFETYKGFKPRWDS